MHNEKLDTQQKYGKQMIITRLSTLLFNLQELFDGNVDCHIFWWFIAFSSSGNIQ